MPAPTPQPDALPLQTRLAPLGEINLEARTIECVWTTGATVRRRRYIGWDTSVPFDEELLVSPEAIDLTRLLAGAPVLDSHATWSTDSQRGVVDAAWLEGGKGLATLRFPSLGTDAASDRLFEMANQRIIKNISVGYAINQVRVVPPKKEGEIERRIIERWTPYELSFVTVPADAGAQTRAVGERSFPVEILGRSAAGIGAAAAARTRMQLRGRSAGLKV